MFRVLTCLATEHDWRLVAVAAVICLLASLTTINLFHRAQATAGRIRLGWLAAAGVATGCGIWATHFIAMLAYDPGIGIAYHIGFNFLSFCGGVAVDRDRPERRRLRADVVGYAARRRHRRHRRRLHALSRHVGSRTARSD